MARPLRIEYPGAFYHIISRGNAGDAIYKTRRDREKFIEYLAEVVDMFGIHIHTYCLMTNHYHLLVETPDPNLSRAIQWLNVSYATYFNFKRDRRGHLFQGRFKSILVDADEYLLHLSRYIHLNPLRAKIVNMVGEFEWSSYRNIVGTEKAPEWLCVSWLLSRFSPKQKVAQLKYREFVEGTDHRKLENPSKLVVAGAILGNEGFVNWVKDTFLAHRQNEPEIPQLKELMPKCSVDAILDRVGEAFECSKEQLLKKGQKRNLARDVAIYLAKLYSGEKGIDIASSFKVRTGSAITMRYKFVQDKIRKDRNLARLINKIQKSIMNN